MGKRRRVDPAAEPVRRWKSPRRRSALLDGPLGSILPAVLGTGAGRNELTACRATCRRVRDALGGDLAAVRLAERRAHVARLRPAASVLATATAVLADNGHLQLDDGLADVASLTGLWDQSGAPASFPPRERRGRGPGSTPFR